MFERAGVSEAEWEAIALEELAENEWRPLTGVDIAPGSELGRAGWDDIVLPGRMLAKMRELNPQVPPEYLEQARAEIIAPKSQDALAENLRLHEICVHGYRGISYIDHQGVEQNPTIRLVSARVEENELLAVSQVTVRSREVERRFDIVLYLNGMPVGIMELKKAGAVAADLASAHAQLGTYLREFPMAFRFAVLTVISDGRTAQYGTPFTPLNHYAPWNVDDDGKPVKLGEARDEEHVGVELEFLIDGLLQSERFLQIRQNFVAFDSTGDGLVKRIAKPHQYFAVTKAVGCTVTAVESDGKAGVVWHTQGSGKSMEMELYAHLVGKQPRLKNPTIVVVTDRTELDGQLFQTFDKSMLLAEKPIQVTSRSELRSALSDRTTGGIYFTTLQKFGLSKAEKDSGLDHPLLTDRRNVIVIVDEAHRSHYDDLDGYARHLKDALPNATLIAFTGTPISFDDRNTRKVFGDYIDIYDLTRAVEDGATVRVIFEPRLPEVKIVDGVTDQDIDNAADEAVLGLDDVERARIEQSVAVINALYGAPARLKKVAKDIVEHWKIRSAEMTKFIGGPGKALIVGGTREICAALYDEIVALEPGWHDDALDKGVIKVVYSGNAKDQEPVSKHVRRDRDNKKIQARLKDPNDPLQFVIVKDMLLTGFDAPPLHTLYLDRPLKGALLMQTLARVNRTFEGKQDGLVVAYAPLAENLEKALQEYTVSDREHRPVGQNTEEMVALTVQLLDALDQLCAGYPWRSKLDTGARSWARAVVGMTEYLRSASTPGNQVPEGEEKLSDRFRTLANQLARAWAVCSGSETLADDRPRARFYEEVRVWMAKYDAEQRKAEGRPVPAEIQRMLAALVAESTGSGEIVDIYAAAGLPKPSLTDLTPEFEVQAREAENPHLAIEALRALLTEEVNRSTRNNLVRQRAFSERIRTLMNKYTNQQLTSAEVIAELIALAREAAAERDRGKQFTPALSEDELAFFDAVCENEAAVESMGDDVLGQIARELVKVMRRDVKTDWTVRDDVRAKLRSSIKRLLIKYKYPPDKQPEAIRLVIEQMEARAPRYAEELRSGAA
ncbi:type I restriction endonuclease subunit R [Nocardia cyriacigeorgica]|uniref:type I restriction endonuclease subunit R n=1 Tax=Nocardia cyriacigeorgica TaxID=135487 RepID=UPI0018951A1D|nr:type I restriction endonuclease subunit R [Nocardia cyriacigeorgica]MBF6289692.1 type I restriction endonuclease subunit R [Nocardia cyriacigeorgica]